MGRTAWTENIKKYVLENPDVPSRTLARLIYGQNPDIFYNVEQIRNRIRYWRGTNGNEHRKHIGCGGE